MSEEPGSEWTTCIRHARPFDEVRQLPPELWIPRWFLSLIAAVALAGALFGYASTTGGFACRVAAGAFQASLHLYLAVTLLDLAEHFRLEKHVTGRWIGATVVPLGEHALHGAILVVLVAIVELARCVHQELEVRDWFVLGAPLVFLGLGWCDELVYHRRCALHREDILHTVSHLAAAAMLVSLLSARMLLMDPP